jgi:hypothetical protein
MAEIDAAVGYEARSRDESDWEADVSTVDVDGTRYYRAKWPTARKTPWGSVSWLAWRTSTLEPAEFTCRRWTKVSGDWPAHPDDPKPEQDTRSMEEVMGGETLPDFQAPTNKQDEAQASAPPSTGSSVGPVANNHPAEAQDGGARESYAPVNAADAEQRVQNPQGAGVASGPLVPLNSPQRGEGEALSSANDPREVSPPFPLSSGNPAASLGLPHECPPARHGCDECEPEFLCSECGEVFVEIEGETCALCLGPDHQDEETPDADDACAGCGEKAKDCAKADNTCGTCGSCDWVPRGSPRYPADEDAGHLEVGGGLDGLRDVTPEGLNEAMGVPLAEPSREQVSVVSKVAEKAVRSGDQMRAEKWLVRPKRKARNLMVCAECGHDVHPGEDYREGVAKPEGASGMLSPRGVPYGKAHEECVSRLLAGALPKVETVSGSVVEGGGA